MMDIVAFFGLILVIVLALISIGVTVFWIWMLIDCLMNEPSEGNDKLIWALVILLTHGVGAIVYFLVRRPQRIEQFGS